MLDVSVIISITAVVHRNLNLLMAKVLHSEEFQLVARLERLIAHELIAVRLLMLCLHVFIWVQQSPLSLVCFGDFAPCSLRSVL